MLHYNTNLDLFAAGRVPNDLTPEQIQRWTKAYQKFVAQFERENPDLMVDYEIISDWNE